MQICVVTAVMKSVTPNIGIASMPCVARAATTTACSLVPGSLIGAKTTVAKHVTQAAKESRVNQRRTEAIKFRGFLRFSLSQRWCVHVVSRRSITSSLRTLSLNADEIQIHLTAVTRIFAIAYRVTAGSEG